MSDPIKDVDEQSTKDSPPEWLFWDREIRLAEKREKKFRQRAKRVNEIYEADKEDDNSFNILYANTETLAPAIYNQLPRAIAERRFKDTDPIGLQVATVVERTLQYLLDSPDAEYEPYDDLFRQAGLAALVPGRGVTWWRYDPQFESIAPPVGDGKEEKGEGAVAAVAAAEPVTGKLLPPANEKVVWETVCGEVVDYDKFTCGYAKRWKSVPWIAREHAMTQEDAEENFGSAVAATMEYLEDNQEGKKEDQGTDDKKNQGSLKTARVYEIWHKSKKEVVFFAPGRKEGLCKDPIDDPYGLSGFFPCSEPLQFLKKTTTLVPTPIYYTYEPQARELNRISIRINRIINAMKVRGFFDGSVQGLNELLSKDDNTLIAAKNVAAMKDGAGVNLSNSIWFMPLDMLVGTVKELYVAREQTKQVIYEITGIADIMRGNTVASETATAQNIKDKWGGLRLQNMQGAMQGYIRESLRIVAELAGKHFGLATFAGMTNLDYATPEQLLQAKEMTNAINAWSAQQQPSVDPSVPPPAPPPQVQQMQQQVQEIQAKPAWEPILAILKDNLQRGYKIDIETNSTLANTSAEDQQNITQAMSAIASMLETFIPAVQIGMMTMAAVKEMLLSVARRFEFGRQVESAIAAMPDQLPQPQANPEQEQKAKELEQQEEQLKGEAVKLEEAKLELQSKEKEIAGDIKMAQKELEMTSKQALQDQQMAYDKFLMDMDKKAMQAEIKNEKRMNQAAIRQSQHESKVSMALAGHSAEVDQKNQKAKLDNDKGKAKTK